MVSPVRNSIVSSVAFLLLPGIAGCGGGGGGGTGVSIDGNGWLIPANEVVDGGTASDHELARGPQYDTWRCTGFP